MKNHMYRRFSPQLLFKETIPYVILSLLLVVVSPVFAKGEITQTQAMVTLEKTNNSLADVMLIIEQNTDYTFFYNDNQVNVKQEIAFDSQQNSVEEILKRISDHTEYTYQIIGKQILIVPDQKISEEIISINSQQQNMVNFKGVVKDARTKEPIIGANILVKGTTNGTITDFDGAFTISAPTDCILVVSYIGYLNQEIIPTSGKDIIILLKEDVEILEEVVVIGYGKVKKNDATGAVNAIKPDQFNKGSQVTAQDALIGKIAGVNITPGSGAPGDGGSIRIRSGSSLSASNDPLIVIDGVPVDNSSISGSTNLLGTINPNDIESFTVLKDASSTAIYGSRASNGVIVITTKKGATGAGVKINYNNNFTVSTVGKTIDVLDGDEFRAFVKEHNASSPDVIANLGTANTDWQKEIYRTSFGHEHNLSATGSIKSMPYRVSVGYTHQNGVIKKNSYERVTAGIGLTPSFFDNHLSVSINIKGSYENNKDIDENVVASAVSFDPTRPIYADNPNNYGLGYFTWLSSAGTPLTIADSNPVADIDLRDSSTKIKRSIGNATLDYKIHGLEDLRFNLNLGYDILKSDGSELIPDYAPKTFIENKKDGQGLDHNFTQEKRNTLLDFYGNYNKEFGIHHIDVMAGYGWQHFWKKSTDMRMNREGKDLFEPTHYESEYYLLSFYGRVNYNIASKYLLTATLRADASSRFHKDNRWGYFPSAAFAWRINQEDFLKDSKVLSDLKLRISYGQTGQQDIGSDYPYMSTYTASYDNARYMFGNKWYTTYRADGYDEHIKWETTETYNAGLDFGFLNGRISGSVDVYFRKTKDLLNKIPAAALSNLASEIYTNVGSMKNSGVEIALNTVPIATKDWNWTLNLNLTYNKSEITKLNTIDSDTYGVMVGPISGTGKTAQIHAVGYAPYSFYLAQQAYDEKGNPIEGKYIQKDGSVGSNDSYRRKIHSPNPDVYMGVSSKLSYKNWDLGFNAHASFGNYIYNYVAANAYKGSVYEANTYKNILRTTRDAGFEAQQLYSDYFLENGSFFRMDNITLGYTFPKLGKTDMSLRLSAAVQNVFVITGYSGLDPESFYRSEDKVYVGIDKNLYPRPRIFMFGLNLNF